MPFSLSLSIFFDEILVILQVINIPITITSISAQYLSLYLF